jgi:site-specific DNA-cytosine methylase
MECYSSDINDFEGIHYVVNILDFDINKLPFHPDIIRASPPCTGFSVAAL